jgi:translation initiation factor IF-2
MNNGKVRIYELSKELSLDNKDILEICEELSISAKSHSSTITEEDATNIRAAATSKSAQKTKPQRPQKKKQEILSVQHHPKGEDRNNAADGSEGLNSAPTRPPARKVERPRLQSPPDRSSNAKPTAIGTEKKNKPNDNPGTAPAPKTPETVTETPKVAAVKPQLVSPPSRPSKAPAKQSLSPGKSAEGNRGGEGGLRPKSPQLRPKPQIVGTVSRQMVGPKDLEPILDPLDVVDDIEDPTPTEELLAPPKRPAAKPKKAVTSMAKPSKRKEWEDEDGETENAKAKGTKLKRRPLVIDDDDEDFESSLNSDKDATPVSLSIARPPRPQKTAANKPPTSPRPRKPSGKKGSGAANASGQKSQKRDRLEAKTPPTEIVLTEATTLRQIAEILCVSETDIIRRLFAKGIAINITQTLDYDIAQMVAEEFDVVVNTPEVASEATKSTEMIEAKDLDHLKTRPPVVTIMGHVDHGKTTLLDSIRKTKVVQGEAGGITQHIGAYHVDVVHNDKPSQIVFLDTPGHEAFTAMRARGARVTDIAVLVVAADDGVRPQTLEAIKHAQAAKVPIVVAINKMDKPTAEPDRVKQELSDQGLLPEEWGGQTIMVPVSALTGENLDTLLEMLLLVSEIEELSANPDRLARGTVIEAHLDRARGPVATLLIQNGTLRVSDIIVAGSVMGKIRAMIGDRGDQVDAATPSFAVEILGLSDVPAAGDEFEVYSNEKEARAIADERAEGNRQSRLQQAMSSRRVSLSSLSAQAQEGELKELNLVLKADVQGSVEAILGSLQQLPQDEVQIRVLLSAPGEITETDVDLAAASGAVIIGFNTTLAPGARQSAEREGVDIREYNVIYRFLEEIQGAMEGLLDPEEVEEHLGKAEVRAVFPVGRGSVAGCYVQSGKVVRNRMVRVRRGNSVIYEGPLDSLKRVREDAREVNSGYECGIGVDKFSTWQEGDIIEAYEMVFKRRTLAGRTK